MYNHAPPFMHVHPQKFRSFRRASPQLERSLDSQNETEGHTRTFTVVTEIGEREGKQEKKEGD
jgi:hypothetical protein